MRRLEGVLLGLAFGAVLMLLARSQDFGRLSRELREADDSLAVLVQVSAQLELRADSLGRIAHRADTVLVTVTEDATAEIDRAWDVARASADSLRVTLDSVEAAHLTDLENAHADEVVAVWRVADSRLAWGESWRALAFARDSVIVNQQSINVQLTLRGALLESALRRERTQTWLTRGASVVAVAAVLVLK